MLTLAFLDLALAGPLLVPVEAAVGVAVVAQVGVEQAWRTAADCTGSCLARRSTRARGGSLVVRAGPSAWAWVEGAALTETLPGASWTGEGAQGGGGVAGRAHLGSAEVLGWLGGDHARLNGDDGPAQRTELDLGAALASPVDESVAGWIGLEGMFAVEDRVGALGGTLPLDFAARVPVRLVAGGTVTSDPLGGPWATRGRLLLSVRGWAGPGAGFDLGVGGSW